MDLKDTCWGASGARWRRCTAWRSWLGTWNSQGHVQFVWWTMSLSCWIRLCSMAVRYVLIGEVADETDVTSQVCHQSSMSSTSSVIGSWKQNIADNEVIVTQNMSSPAKSSDKLTRGLHIVSGLSYLKHGLAIWLPVLSEGIETENTFSLSRMVRESVQHSHPLTRLAQSERASLAALQP